MMSESFKMSPPSSLRLYLRFLMKSFLFTHTPGEANGILIGCIPCAFAFFPAWEPDAIILLAIRCDFFRPLFIASVVMSFVRYRGCLSEMTKVTYFWLPADIRGLALNWLFLCNMFFQFDFYFFAL